MACTRFVLLAVALGVMIADLGTHGGVAGHLRCRKRRSFPSDVTSEVEPDRVRRPLNLSTDPSVNVGSSDESILSVEKNAFVKSSAPAQNQLLNGGHQPSSSSNIQSFGTPGRVPQLEAPHEITRTFIPTDKSGPSSEVVKVGRFHQTTTSATNTAVHTRVVHTVSTTTELYFSYLTLTVTTGEAVGERPTVTVVGNCIPAIVTRYVKDPTATLTVTVPVTHELPPATFYFSTTSDHSGIVSKTKFNGGDQTPNHASVNLRASTFTTPRTLPSPSASGYDYQEPSKRFAHGRSSVEQKKVKRSARTFVDHYSRTVLNY